MRRTEEQEQADIDNLYRSVLAGLGTLLAEGNLGAAVLLCRDFGWAVPVEPMNEAGLINDGYWVGSTIGGLAWARRGGTRHSYRCRRSWIRDNAWSDA